MEGKKEFYYHITEVTNNKKILKEGLKANAEGDIFLFDNVGIIDGLGDKNSVADIIAHNQLFLRDKYAMLEIDANGITSELLPDVVAESSSQCQYLVKQHLIHPKFIKPFGIFKCKFKQNSIEKLLQRTLNKLEFQ